MKRSVPALPIVASALVLCLVSAVVAWGQVIIPRGFVPLNQVFVPEPPNLAQFVKNKAAAIRLGKAFFWDMQVGSDGLTACATCHFHAGADNRRKNTLNPGTRDTLIPGGDPVFGNNLIPGMPDFPQFGPNYTLLDTDFPLHRRANPPDSRFSPIITDTNDVVGSQGVRRAAFVSVVRGSAVDTVTPVWDPVFNIAPDPAVEDPTFNVRRVTARQSPSVINAIFNFNQFWDGRAFYVFNGVNPFGPADPDAGVWFNQGGTIVKQRVAIPFASLASQATGPALDDTEMSAAGRTFPLLGRKMLSLSPLGRQVVHPGDSVLGLLSRATSLPGGGISGANGLNATYAQMIQAAFQNNLWNSANLTPDGNTQMEANFSLYWGLAIQLYVATLVSDQSPFDQWLAGDPAALTAQEQTGFQLFAGIGECTGCHDGTVFTNASADGVAFLDNIDNRAFDIMFTANGAPSIYDTGFNNTAVRPTTEDIGQGGTTPFVNPRTGAQYPLSFSRRAELWNQSRLPFATPLFPPLTPPGLLVTAEGAFKAPTLRNIELTAPYFHNGSDLTLDGVMDFYTRGGNFPIDNLADIDPVIFRGLPLLQGQEAMHAAMIAFMKTLTDPRVAAESAPFDHPELLLPEGEPEILTRLPATDADGVPAPSATLMINAVLSPTSIPTQVVTGTVEAGLTPTITVNGTPVAGVNVIDADWNVLVTGLADGANVVTATVVDLLGVLTTATVTITLDSTPPSLTLNPVASPTATTTQSISGAVEAGIVPVVTVAFPVTATLPFVSGSSWSSLVSNLQQGDNTITVSAVDAAGLLTSLSTSITVDWRAPALTINPVASPTGVPTQIVSGTVEAGIVPVVVVTPPVTAGAVVIAGGTNWSVSISNFQSGSNTIAVSATDAEGNRSALSTAIAFNSAQTISVINHVPARARRGDSFMVSARATSGLPVAITASGACSGVGTGSGTVTMTATSGDCLVAFDQAGDGNINAAPQVTEQIRANAAKNDFDGDGRTDIGAYHADSGGWYLFKSTEGFGQTQFGYTGTLPVAADFDGDGRDDIGVYDDQHGKWFLSKTAEGHQETGFGYEGTIPVVGDFDGDGRDDIGVYDQIGGNWNLFKSAQGFFQTQFGFEGTIPVVGDFDGDGRDDLGVYYPAGGNWYRFKSTEGFFQTAFGYAGTIPVVGDFDGDGRDDIGVYYPAGGNWYLFKSTEGFSQTTFGYAGTEPVVGDFDGDGRDDYGVYYPTGGNWYLFKSTEGFSQTTFGFDGTIPLGGTLR